MLKELVDRLEVIAEHGLCAGFLTPDEARDVMGAATVITLMVHPRRRPEPTDWACSEAMLNSCRYSGVRSPSKSD
jgi:hypothetical protein